VTEKIAFLRWKVAGRDASLVFRYILQLVSLNKKAVDITYKSLLELLRLGSKKER